MHVLHVYALVGFGVWTHGNSLAILYLALVACEHRDLPAPRPKGPLLVGRDTLEFDRGFAGSWPVRCRLFELLLRRC